MISQERLAALAGITRSSVAVHISNLTKKGYIAGKGYVLRGGKYVAVVGGVNLDIGGTPFSPLVAKDSNPGKVTVSPGGVGRNIAHNLSLLGADVRFLTALGDDGFARVITDSCSELGIDISRALRIPGGATPTYVFLNDSDGDMALAVSDMAICDSVTPSYLAGNLALLNNAEAVVADANIPAESLAFLAERCTAPLFVDPVSAKKAGKLLPVLGKLHTLKPNRLEASLLSGVEITGEDTLRLAAKKLLSTGLRRVFISMGAQGVYAAEGETGFFAPPFESKIKNTAGAGDAFTAALVWAFMRGIGLSGSCLLASAAAALNTESESTVNGALTVEAMFRKAGMSVPEE